MKLNKNQMILLRTHVLVLISEHCSDQCGKSSLNPDKPTDVAHRDLWYEYTNKSLDEAMKVLSTATPDDLSISLGVKIKELSKHLKTAPWL